MKRLSFTQALLSTSPVDEGVAQSLAQNKKFSEVLRKAIDDFDKDWCEKEPLVEEAEMFVKKHGGAKVEDIINECKATVACFLKYVEVPEGTIDNVAVNNSTDDDKGGPVDDDAKKEGRDGGRILDEDDIDEDDGEDEEEGDDDDDDASEKAAVGRLLVVSRLVRKGRRRR